MSKRCVCGVCLTLPNVFVLDCKHILCQDCSRVWASAITCPRCHIDDAIDRLSISSANENILDHLAQFFCLTTRELSAEKQNARLSESFSTTSLENFSSARDDGIEKSKVNHTGTAGPASRGTSNVGHKRKVVVGTDDSNPLIDSGDEQPLARKRQKTAASPEADCAINRNIDKELVLLRQTEELKSQLAKAHMDLESQEKTYKERLGAMKQQTGDMTKKAKDISSEAVRETRRQADRIKGLISDLNDQYGNLAAANKTIQQLKAKAEDDKLMLRKAEKRATNFEAWGHQTKAHYQDIIKQMEANQPRSDSTTRSSSHVREYPKELPTLRRVRPLGDMDGDEENLFTPKKKRESAPIIMTPLR